MSNGEWCPQSVKIPVLKMTILPNNERRLEIVSRRLFCFILEAESSKAIHAGNILSMLLL